jgi:acyl dehydratase
MPIDPEAVGYESAPEERSWGSKDTLLYALGVGAGVADPTGFELELTTENSHGVDQAVLPTFAVMVGTGGGAFGRIGSFDPAMLVHGEQAVELHGPIPPAGRVLVTSRVAAVYDKGSAAVVVMESDSVDAESGEPRFTTRSAMFIRGEGGFGGDRGPSGARNPAPEREPDHVVTYPTRADQALLYRLSGDRNPLHSDPAFARRAGFPKPILHGLCTYGFTGRALFHTLCGSDPARFRGMEGRFSKPVFPGDDLVVKVWLDEGSGSGSGSAVFRTENGDGEVVLDQGRVRWV